MTLREFAVSPSVYSERHTPTRRAAGGADWSSPWQCRSQHAPLQHVRISLLLFW